MNFDLSPEHESFRAVVRDFARQEIAPHAAQWDRDCTRYECVFIGLRREREDQAHRINERVRRMIAEGLVDEVKSLLAEAKPLSTAARQALGYAEIIQHLEGRCTLADAVEMIKINTQIGRAHV